MTCDGLVCGKLYWSTQQLWVGLYPLELWTDSQGKHPGIIIPSVKALPFYVFSQEDKLGSDWVEVAALEVQLEATFKFCDNIKGQINGPSTP